MTSRDTRQRNTFGRSLTLGFTVSATRSANGSAACAIPLPMWDGRCRRPPGKYVRVLKYSNAHATPTLRRTERSRAWAESSDVTRGRRGSAMADISLRPLDRPSWHGRRGTDTVRIGHCDLHLCHLALLAKCCAHPGNPYIRAPNVW